MDVATGASAPPIEAMATPEPAPTAAPATAELAPELTAAVPPIDPAMAAALPEAAEADEAAAPPARPTLFQRAIVAPFWAGLLGCGTAFWIGAIIGAFFRAHLVEQPTTATILSTSVLLGLGLALGRGFRAPLQSYASLIGRVVGTLVFGGLSALVTVLILAAIFDGLHVRDLPALLTLAVLGAVLAGLALLRIHGLGAARPRRIKVAAAAFVVALISIWPSSPVLRCRLGFAEGCRAAADVEVLSGDYLAAQTHGAIGCGREDGLSCRLAGMAFAADQPQRDLDRAEAMFREGCAIGDGPSCDRVHTLELQRRCDRYGAFACAELARAHAQGDGAPRDAALAQRYYRKACLLGADDACREAGAR